MEIREENIIINVDEKLDAEQETIIKDMAVILRAVVEAPQPEFKRLTLASLETIMSYIIKTLD